MALAGKEVGELRGAAEVVADAVGVNGVRVVAQVEVERQIRDFAGVLGALVANGIGEPQVCCVGGVLRRGIGPRLGVRKCLVICDRLLLELGVRRA